MPEETGIALDCPCCGESIYAPLSWFKESCPTCPHCSQSLAAGQFRGAIAALEEAMAASIEEMVLGAPRGGCCGARSSCKR